ncbi:hypothetical protein [Streptomyces carminius]|uniref:hypothetical protein n=1 Tax=Streptomyces carminius TaxID=2665496 RepID=UPI00130449BF|nr:hypothetical protein [Streptomyces carminius]
MLDEKIEARKQFLGDHDKPIDVQFDLLLAPPLQQPPTDSPTMQDGPEPVGQAGDER